MKIMREILIISAIFIFFGYSSIAQKKQSVELVNQVRIEIIDVVERNQLFDLNLIMCYESDTIINIHIDSTDILIFDLNSLGNYNTTIIKDDYDTLSIEWSNPVDSAELILEFYMPKTKLNRSDKRKAHSYSKDLPERPCAHCGGFKRITVAYNEMCVIRFRKFVKGQYSGSSYDFRKLKYY